MQVNNLLNKHTYLLLFLIQFSCNSQSQNDVTVKLQVSFSECGLRVACTRAIKTINNEIHGVHYVDNNGKQINKDSILNLLYYISKFDDFSQSNSTKYTTKQYELYEKNNPKEKSYKLITTGYLMENPGNLPIDNPIKTEITLKDFDLFLNDKQKQITVRVLNDYEIIKIKIDELEINRLSESIPIGLEKVIFKLDSLKEKQNASRQQEYLQ